MKRSGKGATLVPYLRQATIAHPGGSAYNQHGGVCRIAARTVVRFCSAFAKMAFPEARKRSRRKQKKNKDLRFPERGRSGRLCGTGYDVERRNVLWGKVLWKSSFLAIQTIFSSSISEKITCLMANSSDLIIRHLLENDIGERARPAVTLDCNGERVFNGVQLLVLLSRL